MPTKIWTPEEQAAHRKAWVEALLSGEYRQGQSFLAQEVCGIRRYCCLGVACELAVREGVIEIDEPQEVTTGVRRLRFGQEVELLPHAVADWLGLASTDGTYVEGAPMDPESSPESLSGLNDRGASFDCIAEVIEEEPFGLLGPVEPGVNP